MTTVTLALYDLSNGMAKQLSASLLGQEIEAIWHTGLLVYGKEWFFGGGIQVQDHQEFKASRGLDCQYIELGKTEIPEELFANYLRELSPQFTPHTYDLLKWNCNNFTDTVSQFLLGKGIPSHILELPSKFLSTPMGSMLRPMLEGMAPGMMGGDPFGSMASKSSVPAPDFRACPTLKKHDKPLLSKGGLDTADALINRTKQSPAAASPESAAVLSALGTSLKEDGAPPSGCYALLLEVIRTQGPYEITALCLLRLVLLKAPLGPQQVGAYCGAIAGLGKCIEAGSLSGSSLALAFAAAGNACGTSAGWEAMASPSMLPKYLQAGLAGLANDKEDVRVTASALLNNLSLILEAKCNAGALCDEATQLICGTLGDVASSSPAVTTLRRLVSAGRLIYSLSEAAALVRDCGLADEMEQLLATADSKDNTESRLVCREILGLLTVV
ncbi:unnamed protein product [Chrysoparadoxa australica]